MVTGDAWRAGVREDPGPALDDRLAIFGRGPSRVKAGDRCPLRPERVHRLEITRRKRPVELEIGRKHGILIGHRDPRICRRTIRRWRACRQSIDTAAPRLGTAACSVPLPSVTGALPVIASIFLPTRG